MPNEIDMMVAKPKGFFQKALNRFGFVSKKNYIIGEGEKAKTLPNPLETYIKLSGNVEKTGITQFSYQYLRDLTYTSDVLTLIMRTLTSETFRNGIDVKERFKSKCVDCGREFEEIQALCPYCNGVCRLPDYEDWKRLMAFLRKTNKFDDSPMKTMMQVDTDINILDNGWILLYRTYIYDEAGRIIGSSIKEMIRMDADKMRLIMSNYGMGYDDMGNPTYFCPMHREEVKLKQEPRDDYSCEKCGGVLLPAWYMAKVGAISIYYSPKEIFHLKKWSMAQGYGVSPIVSCWQKVNTLLRMDRFMLDAYSLQRSPQQLLILRGKADSIHKAWQYLMQKARENPNMIYPLVIEDTGDTRKRIVESERFELKPVEWQWESMRNEFSRKIGAVYGVQPLFMEGTSSGGGLSVRADTPIVIRKNERIIDIVPIAALHTDYWHKKNIYGLKNLEVLDGNGKWTPVLHTYRHKAKKDEIKTIMGSGMVAISGDHSIILEDGRTARGNDLKEGNKIVTVEFPINHVGDAITKELAYALGLFLAEGTSMEVTNHMNGEKQGVRVSISNTNMKLLERAKPAMDAFFGVNGTFVTVSKRGSMTMDGYRLEYNHRHVFDWMNRVCYSSYREAQSIKTKLIREKKVPEQILNGGDEIVDAFLEGYWDGDGTTKNGEVSCVGTYKALMGGIYYLLKRIGKNVAVDLREGSKTQKEQIRLRIIDGNGREAVRNQVKKIIKVPYKGDWYDIETESHTFVSAIGGIVLHNSNEGLQIAATNRTIMMGQSVWNSFLEWLGLQLETRDYVMRLEPNEQEDKLRDMDIESKRIAIAQAMASLGWEGELHSDMGGLIEFSYKRQRKQPEEVKPPKESTEAPSDMNPPLQTPGEQKKANYESKPIKYKGKMKTGAEDATTNGSSGGNMNEAGMNEW